VVKGIDVVIFYLFQPFKAIEMRKAIENFLLLYHRSAESEFAKQTPYQLFALHLSQ
jgi:hypothetical protein